jgi:hypothetical protein
VDIYRFVPDSDRYECISVSRERRGVFAAFRDCQSLAGWWKPIPIEVDSSTGPAGDFPSLYRRAPVFSEQAWEALGPLVAHVAEALPIIYPNDRKYFVINVLDMVDCLDHSTSIIDRYSDGRISHVEHYTFHPDRLTGKHFFKIPESAGLEVLVSDEFRQAVESHGLKGLVFQQLR